MTFEVAAGVFHVPVAHNAELAGVFRIGGAVFVADIPFAGIVLRRVAQPQRMADFMGEGMAAILIGIRVANAGLVVVEPGAAGQRMRARISSVGLGRVFNTAIRITGVVGKRDVGLLIGADFGKRQVRRIRPGLQ